jgi:hypothetical protein
MPVKFLHVGGGPIGDRDYRNEVWGEFHPQGIANCCSVGLPEAALWYDPKYIGQFSPARTSALACYLERSPVAVGEKLVLSLVHAGIVADLLTVDNRNGCSASQFRFELHDLNALVTEAQGGAPSTAEVVFPTINGASRGMFAYDVTAANSGNVYFGNPYGSVSLPGGGTAPCKRHKALVLVFSALPDTNAVPQSENGSCAPCQYGRVECDAGAMACVDIVASLHVRVPGGLQHT